MNNNILSECQFGFRTGHSCIDALSAMINKIYEDKNNNQKVCLVTIDIKKAFDIVSHDILLHKLFKVGLDWKSLIWFNSYLSQRKQLVKEGETKSEMREIKVGVPQGSILGPLLFSIFINDLMNCNLGGNAILYADDCSIVYSGSTYAELENKVNSSLIIINNWMMNNKLTINTKKSNYMIIDLSGRNNMSLDLKLGGQTLTKASKTKILGVIFDDNLRFKSHISDICSIINARIGVLSRLKKFVPKNILNCIFKAIVQPKIDYGITIYGNNYPTNIKRITKLMNRASRIITSSDKETDILFKELHWKSFSTRRRYFTNIFIYRCLNGLAPHLCNGLFVHKSSKNKTRSVENCELLVPRRHSETFGHSMFLSGAQDYNKLDKNTRNAVNLKVFINLLRKN